MRIENILLKNYRQFKDVGVSLLKKSDNDLHIFIGKNGTGKTNVLNAINWCLYGDEPHLARDSRGLPILNLNSIKEAKDGGDKEVLVEVQVKTNDNKRIIFTRKAVHRVYKEEKRPKLQKTEFEVKVEDNKGNIDIVKGDEADSYVGRFVPKEIRDFFFFDGERLDNYFREATVENIRHAITVISQVDLLEKRIEKKLSKILRELRKKAGKVNPEIEKKRNELEKYEDSLKNVEEKIEEYKKQIKIAKTRIRECEEKLRGIPDIEVLEENRLKLKASRKHAEKLLETNKKEKQDLLFDYGKIIMLWPAINASIQNINEKRQNKEIPPLIDKSVLEDILNKKACNICGTPLNSISEKHVNNLLEEIRLSSTLAQLLLNMENPLYRFKDKIKEFKREISYINHKIINLGKELKDIERKMNKIERNLSGYKTEKIKRWHEDRKKFEEAHDENMRLLGVANKSIKESAKKIDELKEDLDKELKKEKRVKELKKEIDFCVKSLYVVKATKENIMNEQRQKIEYETNKLFSKLIWKKETFKNIIINDDYDIELIHSMGYECIGSISAAERELLALSFTLALHTISGFDSPILIDTPVARVTDEHRENIGKIFLEVCKNKQIILLFTPAEYSIDISKSLDKKSSNRFNIKLSSDEKEAKFEVI